MRFIYSGTLFLFLAFCLGLNQPTDMAQRRTIEDLRRHDTYFEFAQRNFFEKEFQPQVERELKLEEKNDSEGFVDKYIAISESVFEKRYNDFQKEFRRKRLIGTSLVLGTISVIVNAPWIIGCRELIPPVFSSLIRLNFSGAYGHFGAVQAAFDTDPFLTLSFLAGSLIALDASVTTTAIFFDTLPYILPKKLTNYLYENELYETPIKSLMKNYARKRGLLPQSIQEKIDGMFKQYWLNPADSTFSEIKQFLDIVLRLPLKRLELKYDEEKVKRTFKYYSQEIKEGFDDYIFNTILNENSFNILSSNGDTRYPVYLVGKPGTGKSYGANLIAKALGDLPVARLFLDGATIDDITGTNLSDNGGKPGRILEALVENNTLELSGVKNQILFIDEFDRVLTSDDYESRSILSFILKVMDPDRREFYSPYLETTVKLPDIIVLAGNFDLRDFDDERFEALISRLEILKFSGFSKEAKRSLVFDSMIPRILKKYKNNSDKRYSISKLEEEDKKQISEFIDKDEDPGLRSVQKYVKKIIERRIKKNLINFKRKHFLG